MWRGVGMRSTECIAFLNHFNKSIYSIIVTAIYKMLTALLIRAVARVIYVSLLTGRVN